MDDRNIWFWTVTSQLITFLFNFFFNLALECTQSRRLAFALALQGTLENRFSSWLEANHEFSALLSTINCSKLFFLVLARDWSSGLDSRPLIGWERPSSRLRLHQQCSEGKHRASRMLILVNIREQFSNGFDQLLSSAFLRGGTINKIQSVVVTF